MCGYGIMRAVTDSTCAKPGLVTHHNMEQRTYVRKLRTSNYPPFPKRCSQQATISQMSSDEIPSANFCFPIRELENDRVKLTPFNVSTLALQIARAHERS